MSPKSLLFIYCCAIVLASLAGGYLPLVLRMTHLRTQLMMSFVGGLMLGVSLFQMLPHAAEELGSVDVAVRWLLGGLITMFFAIRVFHFHQHELPEAQAADQACNAHEHAPEGHGHAAHHHAGHHHASPATHWIGVALGLSLHTMIDGIALAANVAADGQAGVEGPFLGLATFLAVALHKPLDALSITALMSAAHWSIRARQMVNFAFSLMCPLGVVLFYVGLSRYIDAQAEIIGGALAFSAGAFLCIALADVLPELEFHSHDKVALSTALLCGVALAFAIAQSESHGHHEHGNHHHGANHSHPHEAIPEFHDP
jgi:zinc and cadmium transporter